MSKDFLKLKTIKDLKNAGYKPKSIKEELRDNLIKALKSNDKVFEGIKGYESTVLPQLYTALLSRHNIILLGLRGQAKTRLARLMLNLLDEYIPVVTGSDLNDDPFRPISLYSKNLIEEKGDDTPISWVKRNERYTEKLATPDVSVADLIGDLDPIKAASLKLTYADERIIHYGLIPRSHRGVFVINELPDLQARIQVSLFNILQEGDIQIRGFKVRLPLDIQFVFTANPEDYTNRGSIITPLKDRIESQILTHYPKTLALSKEITQQEANVTDTQKEQIYVPELLKDLIEEVAFQARESEYVDQKSGVSARLTISAYENLVSQAERRMIINNESKARVRIADLYSVIPAITGKVELVYEGEVEGISNVAYYLIGKSIRSQFENYFPNPEKSKKKKDTDPFNKIVDWFNAGNDIELGQDLSEQNYEKILKAVPSLDEPIKNLKLEKDDKLLFMEFILHGLAEFSQLSKQKLDGSIQFRDLMGSMFNLGPEDEDDEEGFNF